MGKGKDWRQGRGLKGTDPILRRLLEERSDASEACGRISMETSNATRQFFLGRSLEWTYEQHLAQFITG